jgi:hypothetical protein
LRFTYFIQGRHRHYRDEMLPTIDCFIPCHRKCHDPLKRGIVDSRVLGHPSLVEQFFSQTPLAFCHHRLRRRLRRDPTHNRTNLSSFHQTGVACGKCNIASRTFVPFLRYQRQHYPTRRKVSLVMSTSRLHPVTLEAGPLPRSWSWWLWLCYWQSYS